MSKGHLDSGGSGTDQSNQNVPLSAAGSGAQGTVVFPGESAGRLGDPCTVKGVDPIFAEKAPPLSLLFFFLTKKSNDFCWEAESASNTRCRGPSPSGLLTFVLLQGLLGGLQDGLVELVRELFRHEGLPRLALSVDAVRQRHGNVLGRGAPDVVEHAQALLAPRGLTRPGLLTAGGGWLLDALRRPELFQPPRLRGLRDVRQGGGNTHRLLRVQGGLLRGGFLRDRK